MIGFKQFQDDLKTLRLALYGRMPSDLAHQALTRVEGFANTLENLDVHEMPEMPQGAPPEGEWHTCCGNKLSFGQRCPDCRTIRYREC